MIISWWYWKGRAHEIPHVRFTLNLVCTFVDFLKLFDVSIDEFVTFSEASFSKELAFKVSTDTDFSTFFLKLLLYNGLT